MRFGAIRTGPVVPLRTICSDTQHRWFKENEKYRSNFSSCWLQFSLRSCALALRGERREEKKTRRNTPRKVSVRDEIAGRTLSRDQSSNQEERRCKLDLRLKREIAVLLLLLENPFFLGGTYSVELYVFTTAGIVYLRIKEKRRSVVLEQL